ncbi:MAG: DUF3783 domain-containing protein [Porcipelethomonas sp.]
MRSRIRKVSKVLAGYMLDEVNREALDKFCREKKIEFRAFGREAAGKKVGFIAGFSGFDSENCSEISAPEEECLVISGFSGSEMDRLLNQLRNSNIKIDLKCVVTAYNQNWTVSELISELKKEHEAMNLRKASENT